MRRGTSFYNFCRSLLCLASRVESCVSSYLQPCLVYCDIIQATLCTCETVIMKKAGKCLNITINILASWIPWKRAEEPPPGFRGLHFENHSLASGLIELRDSILGNWTPLGTRWPGSRDSSAYKPEELVCFLTRDTLWAQILFERGFLHL